MNFTLSHFDGPIGVGLVLESATQPVSVQAGTTPTLQAVQVHLGLSGAVAGGSYTHNQSVAADTWTVNHNLGFRPAIRALTVGGSEVWGEVLHVSANQTIIYFDSPLAGSAICS